jgi:hypothetical protein
VYTDELFEQKVIVFEIVILYREAQNMSRSMVLASPERVGLTAG